MSHQTLFTIVGGIALALWILALVGYFTKAQSRVSWGALALAAGWLLLIAYVLWYWHLLGSPPMRTLKETLLWVTLCLPAIGLLTEWRWDTRLIATISGTVATLLLAFLLILPEAMDKELPPALRSPWFAPHVIIYMAAYAILLGTAVLAIVALIRSRQATEKETADNVELVRRLIYIAFPLVTVGMVLGAIWGKIAWGHYWTWDPKETMAFITWAVYLGYIHLERYAFLKKRGQLVYAFASFLAVVFCWFIVNFLPSTANSLHTYSMGK